MVLLKFFLVRVMVYLEGTYRAVVVLDGSLICLERGLLRELIQNGGMEHV